MNGSSSDSASGSDRSSASWSSLCSESSSCSWKPLCQCWPQKYFSTSTLTVGICQLPSREIFGGSVGAMALLARSEARVMRGIVKEYVNVFSWPKACKLEECALLTRVQTLAKNALNENYSIAKLFEALAKSFFSFSPMSYRQSLESRDVRFNGCLGPSRTSCVLTTASERSGNRCSTNQTSIRRHEDSARKNDLLQLHVLRICFSSHVSLMRS
jgi:hypothetical protein